MRRFAPLVAGILVVTAMGLVGLRLNSRATHKAETVHREDRETLQKTLSGLGKQYVLFALKEEFDTASTGPWSLQPGDPADTARLKAFVGRSAIFTYGAALVDLGRNPLNGYAVEPEGLPPVTDPGLQPLIKGLLAQQPGLSSVMHVGKIPVVGLAVPVMVEGAPRAVLVAFWRADRSALQTYVEGLRYGATGGNHIVDSDGGIIAAASAPRVGTQLPAGPARDALLKGRTGFVEFTRDGVPMVASYAPFGIGGWGAVIEQRADEFFGPIRDGGRRVNLALLTLLGAAAIGLALLNQRRIAALQRVSDQAFHDSLTGLPNRTLFQQRVNAALSRTSRQGGRVAVLFLDLDRFKAVNDSAGHDHGDHVLQAVATRLRGALRTEDTLARIGGDEFTVLLEDLDDPTDAIRAADRLITAFEAPFVVGGREAVLGVSVGITLGDSTDSAEDLLRDADLAMYSAKEHGKGRWEFFEAAMGAEATRKLRLEADLRRAVAGDELRLQFQPIVSLQTGEIEGIEALARWQHSEVGLLSPDAFIPLAEESGLIVQLGHWVLRDACRVAAGLRDSRLTSRPLGLSVNVSGRQLRRGDAFVAEVADVLAETGFDAASLTLEITENVLVGNEANGATLSALRNLGVRIVLDDFGTGYSSLSYLTQFPVTGLKLDKSFVAGIDDPVNAAIARSVISLAASIGVDVIAEGIESRAQVDQLVAMGCRSGQGFALHRPMAEAALEDAIDPVAVRL